jgi:hypothetical protein
MPFCACFARRVNRFGKTRKCATTTFLKGHGTQLTSEDELTTDPKLISLPPGHCAWGLFLFWITKVTGSRPLLHHPQALGREALRLAAGAQRFASCPQPCRCRAAGARARASEAASRSGRGGPSRSRPRAALASCRGRDSAGTPCAGGAGAGPQRGVRFWRVGRRGSSSVKSEGFLRDIRR